MSSSRKIPLGTRYVSGDHTRRVTAYTTDASSAYLINIRPTPVRAYARGFTGARSPNQSATRRLSQESGGGPGGSSRTRYGDGAWALGLTPPSLTRYESHRGAM